jgi:lipase chaperone LimK
MNGSATNISEDRRREIYRQLVALQEAGLAPRSSREMVARQQKLGADVVKSIEQEGRDKGWAPLDQE